MGSLNHKQQNEQIEFKRFVERLGTQNNWVNIQSRPEPEPDLLCLHQDGEEVAFELVSLTDPKIAKIKAAGEMAYQEAFSTSDPSERIVRNKLNRSYITNADHIELLIYTDGQIITTDDVIIPTILPLFDEISHPFREIWFMGEFQVGRLWRR